MATKYTFNFSDVAKTPIDLYPYTANGPVSPTDNTLIDKAVAQDTTLKLYGKGMADYGEGIEQNLIYMLENFANNVPPINAIDGQIWVNTIGVGSPPSGMQMYVYDSTYVSGPTTNWNGIILSSGSSAMTGELILSGIPTSTLAAIPKLLLDEHIDGTTAGYDSHLSSLERTFLSGLDLNLLTSNEVMYLDGVTSSIQPQLDDKISRQGDSMDNGANFGLNNGDIILSGSSNISFTGSGEVIGLPAVPSAANAAASKAYVDSSLLSGAGDTITALSWTQDAGSPLYVANISQTDLNISVIYPDSTVATFTAQGISRIGHAHAASEITFDNTGSPPLGITGLTVQSIIENIDFVKADKVSPIFTGPVTINGQVNINGGDIISDSGASFNTNVTAADPIISTHLTTKLYVDNLFTGITPPSVIVDRKLEKIPLGSPVVPLTIYKALPHTVGENRLSVSVNGIKQYVSSSAYVDILYDNGIFSTVDNTTPTGLTDTDQYSFNISVDGSPAVDVLIAASVTNQFHGGLKDSINLALSNAGISASIKFNLVNGERMFTDTTGDSSSIIISPTVGSGSPLSSAEYLYKLDPSPTAIVSATYSTDQPLSNGTPDTIIVSGDQTSAFTTGRSFTIRGMVDPLYGSGDDVYTVHASGASYNGGTNETTVPIGYVTDNSQNYNLFKGYNPFFGSPLPPAPNPSAFGDVHFTTLGAFTGLDNSFNSGISADYIDCDQAGVQLPEGSETDYIKFIYTLNGNLTIESILLT